jgi:hypothetical protein
MSVAVGRNAKELAAFARKWSWRQITTRWQDLCEDEELRTTRGFRLGSIVFSEWRSVVGNLLRPAAMH